MCIQIKKSIAATASKPVQTLAKLAFYVPICSDRPRIVKKKELLHFGAPDRENLLIALKSFPPRTLEIYVPILNTIEVFLAGQSETTLLTLRTKLLVALLLETPCTRKSLLQAPHESRLANAVGPLD
jgi:hypothetical protein